MWASFGICAIIFTIWHVVRAMEKKDGRIVLMLALSLTTLTVCAFYADAAHLVEYEDWGALIDIMPTVADYLWKCTIASIVINGAAGIYNSVTMKK